jgi:hypothetical protein
MAGCVMMESVRSSETSGNFYQTTWCHVPGESNSSGLSVLQWSSKMTYLFIYMASDKNDRKHEISWWMFKLYTKICVYLFIYIVTYL